ncbi:MAG: hypothetical protein J1D88_03785 [Treponema sp.]|nr:hypothetical protein [Treponema sp.]
MNKLRTLVLGAAFVACASVAGAQTASLHGKVDYTNFGLGQRLDNFGNGDDWDHTDPAAEFGNAGNGETTVDLRVTAANFLFNFGLRLNSSLWQTGDYYVSDDQGLAYVQTIFYQGNIRAAFFNEQFFIYTGKFEDWNAGYISEGYVLGGQQIHDLASHSVGQHITALEIAPYALKGFKFMAALPILPGHGNDVNTNIGANHWKNLYKKFKLVAQYKLPIEDTDIILNAGWRPGTYYSGVEAYHKLSKDEDGNYNDFTKSFFGEAYIQGNFFSLVPGFDLNATYDFRYRDGKYTTVTSGTKEHFTTAHMVGVSANLGSDLLQVENLSLAIEDRFFYADDDYIFDDEKLIYNRIGARAGYKFGDGPWELGLVFVNTLAADARSTAFSKDGSGKYGKVISDSFDDIAVGYNKMAISDNFTRIPNGDSGNYHSEYLNPFVQYNLSNGFIRLGVELQFAQVKTGGETYSSFNYRVPVGFCFWF